MYNLQVAGDHSYFVEDGSGEKTAVWVHNAGDNYGNAKKLDPRYLKNVLKINAENFKKDFVPPGTVSRWNVHEDTQTGELILVAINPSTGSPIHTGYTFALAQEHYPY